MGHFIRKYRQVAFQISSRTQRVWLSVMYLLVVWQIICILSARNHYSVDIVVSLWLTPIFTQWFESIEPEDREYTPELEDVFGGLLQRFVSAKEWHQADVVVFPDPEAPVGMELRSVPALLRSG